MKQNVSWTYSSYRRKQTLRNWTVMLATFFCAYWAGISCKVDLDALRAGIPKGIEFISYLFGFD